MTIVAGKFDQASIAKLGEKMMAWFQIHTPSLASASDIVELRALFLSCCFGFF